MVSPHSAGTSHPLAAGAVEAGRMGNCQVHVRYVVCMHAVRARVLFRACVLLFLACVLKKTSEHVYVPVSAVLMCRSCLPVSAAVSTCTFSLSPPPPFVPCVHAACPCTIWGGSGIGRPLLGTGRRSAVVPDSPSRGGDRRVT